MCKEYIPNIKYCARLNEFLKYQYINKNKSDNTIEKYGFNINEVLQYIKKKKQMRGMGDCQLKRLSRQDILDYTEFIVEIKGQSPATVNNKLVSISMFTKYLVLQNIIKSNPYHDVELQDVNTREREYMTEDEAVKLLSIIKNTRDKAIFTIFINNGLRCSELIELKSQDVKDKKIKVIGKGDKERKIFFNDNTLNLIQNWLQDREKINTEEECLFVNDKGKKLSRQLLDILIKEYGELAGINKNKCHIHALRHTFAMLEIKNGCDIYKLQKLLGHSDLKTTEIYAHLDDESLSEANSLINIS